MFQCLQVCHILNAVLLPFGKPMLPLFYVCPSDQLLLTCHLCLSLIKCEGWYNIVLLMYMHGWLSHLLLLANDGGFLIKLKWMRFSLFWFGYPEHIKEAEGGSWKREEFWLKEKEIEMIVVQGASCGGFDKEGMMKLF